MNKRATISSFYGQIKKKRFTSVPQNDCNALSEATLSVNATESAFAAVKELFPVKELCFRLPPVIFLHQVYNIIKNRTVADKDIYFLAENGVIRLFKLGFKDNTIVAIFSEDFNRHVMERVCPCQVETNNVELSDDLEFSESSVLIKKTSTSEPLLTIDKCKSGSVEFSKSKTSKTCYQSQTVTRFIREVAPKLQDVSVDKEVLQFEYHFSEEDLRTLMNVGLLAVRSVGSYWLSFPNAGEFMKHFSRGRASLIRLIKKCKFSEILQPELEKRQLEKTAKFGIKYHIYDLIGADIVQCIETTSGTLLRIRK